MEAARAMTKTPCTTILLQYQTGVLRVRVIHQPDRVITFNIVLMPMARLT
jgi:hypothetical protein